MNNTIIKDNGDWEKNPYAVVLRKPLDTTRAYWEWKLALEHEEATTSEQWKTMLDQLQDEVPYLFYPPNLTDSSVGGNDAINCYWSFGEDDDIVYKDNFKTKNLSGGLGRVYDDIYNSQQQLIWLRFGVPEYSGVTNFFDTEDNAGELSTLMNGMPMSFKLGSMLGGGVGLAIAIPMLPLKWASKIFALGTADVSTRYVSFKNYMPVYYRFVNTLMAHLSAGMRLYPFLPSAFDKGADKTVDTYKEQLGDVVKAKQDKAASDAVKDSQESRKISNESLPEVLQNGPDIYAIMDKRAVRANIISKARSTDTLTNFMKPAKEVPKEANSFGEKVEVWTKECWDSFKMSAIGATDFIAFRVEKSTQASESFSNNTGPSSLAQTLNGKATEHRNARYTKALISETGFGWWDSLVNAGRGFVKGMADKTGLGKALSAVTGTGFFNIEDTWTNSSFQKSHNINIQLRSRYGDPISIFQSIYIPLCCLLAGGTPRSIGSNAYTSPFIVNAYCKGMFAIPMGMITNLSITRGLPEYGWNNKNLPTAVNVSLTIKDLTPVMHITLAETKFLDMFKRNDNMHEYLSTLSGLGLMERNFGLKILMRKVNALLAMKKSTIGNPSYWGIELGHNTMVRYVSRFLPYSALSNK